MGREKILDPRFAGLQYEIQRLGDMQKKLYDLLNPRSSVLDIFTISKAAAFTDTEVNCQGSNLIQISTDGKLANVSYKVIHEDDRQGQSMEAAESPHIIGPVRGVFVTNDTAETGKTVRIARYMVSPLMVPAIVHGSPTAATIELSRRPFYGEKLEYTASASNYFESDEAVGDAVTLYLDNVVPADATTILIHTIMWALVPTNAVTYELMLADASASVPGTIQNEADVFFSSGSGLTSGTLYIQVAGGATSRLPVQHKLGTAGQVGYKVDWSAAPGDTYGYVKVYGEVIA